MTAIFSVFGVSLFCVALIIFGLWTAIKWEIDPNYKRIYRRFIVAILIMVGVMALAFFSIIEEKRQEDILTEQYWKGGAE